MRQGDMAVLLLYSTRAHHGSRDFVSADLLSYCILYQPTSRATITSPSLPVSTTQDSIDTINCHNYDHCCRTHFSSSPFFELIEQSPST